MGLVIAARLSGGDMLAWSIASVGLMISYYYGQTGIACAVFYCRYAFTSLKNFFFVGLLPLVGGMSLGAVFIKSVYDMTNPDYTDRPRRGWVSARCCGWVSACSSAAFHS